MPKLTAMVSIYNSGRWIKNRLDNILKSSIINDIEIYCVNANSPDPLDHEIPLEYSHKYPQVKYEKLDERINVYKTWNYIISKSEATYVTNANTDDIVSPQCYEILVSALDNNPQYDFAYPNWYATAKDNQQWPPVEVDPSGKPGHFHGDISRSGIGHFPMWRKSLHNILGPLDDTFEALADADWWTRCALVNNSKFLWVDQFLACYLWRDGQNLWHTKITSEEWAKYHGKVAQYRQK